MDDLDFIELERNGFKGSLLLIYSIFSIPLFVWAIVHIFTNRNYALLVFPILVASVIIYALKEIEKYDYSKIKFTKDGIFLNTLRTFTLKEEISVLSLHEVSHVESYDFLIGKPKGITVFLKDGTLFSLDLIFVGRSGIPGINYYVNTNQKSLAGFLEKVSPQNPDSYYSFKFVTHLTDSLRDFGYTIQ